MATKFIHLAILTLAAFTVTWHWTFSTKRLSPVRWCDNFFFFLFILVKI